MTEITKTFNRMYENNTFESEMIEKFAQFAHINTIDEMMQLGMDGVRYCGYETAYENLYRLAKKCFKGNERRDNFASSILYYFWQNFAFGMGLMAVQTIENGVATMEPIGSVNEIFKRA